MEAAGGARKEKPAKVCRREVLVPGEHMPDQGCPPGKHHGTVTRVVQVEGRAMAVIKMTDFQKGKLHIQVPLDKIAACLLPKKEKPRKPREFRFGEAKRPAAAPAAKPAGPRKKRKRHLPPGSGPRRGPELLEFMKRLEGVVSAKYPVGTRLWVRVPGSGRSPGVSWSFGLVKRRDMGQLVETYREGLICVRFYGEHSAMWVREEDCELPPADESELQRQYKAWGRQHNKIRMVELALDEMLGAHDDPDKERARMIILYDQYLQTRQALDNCYLCRELGARLECCVCDRLFHPLCLREPVVSEEELQEAQAGRWACPCCGEDNVLGEEGGEDEEGEEGGEEAEERKQERMGLTPDWLIEAAAFHVFQLERPTAQRPYIPRLLDPCTNSKLAPNIPAEKLYDKRDNGLKLSNSWGGYYCLLNPEYKAQIQWRFINRCIDEVENGAVPAAVLICRNSTDTAYFQRLRPYPRVMLRRMSARFKDYDKTPIGFGIAVFCIAKEDCKALYERFFDALEPMGEPNIPVDRTFVQSEEYHQLLERLRLYADQHHRDHWVQCSLCEKWRMVDFVAAQQIRDDDEWTCALLRPPYTNCDTPLSARELMGGRYAAHRADFLTQQEEQDEEFAAVVEEEPQQEAAEEEAASRDEGKTEGQQVGGSGKGSAAAAAEAGREGSPSPAAAHAGRKRGKKKRGAWRAAEAEGADAEVEVEVEVEVAASPMPQTAVPVAGMVGAPRPLVGLPAIGGAWRPLNPAQLAAAWRPLLAAMAAARPGMLRPLLLPGQQAPPLLGPAGLVRLPLPPGFPPLGMLQGMPLRPLLPMPPGGAAVPGGAVAGQGPRPLALPPGFNLPLGMDMRPIMLPPFPPFPPTPTAQPPGPVVAAMAAAASPTAASADGSGSTLASAQSPTAGALPALPLSQAAEALAPAPGAAAAVGAVAAAAAAEGQGQAGQAAPEEAATVAASGGSSPAAGVAASIPADGSQARQQGSKEEAGADREGSSGSGGDGTSSKREPPQAAAPAPPTIVIPDPLPPAAEVVCEQTLRELIQLPRRNITLDREEGGDTGQVLTALELARQARIAANRAYLAGLGLGPAALHGGHLQPLPPDDPVMLQAARELAMRAAAEEARRQLGAVRQRYEAARRRRARMEPLLLKQLRELAEEEEEAQKELAAAEAAIQEFGGSGEEGEDGEEGVEEGSEKAGVGDGGGKGCEGGEACCQVGTAVEGPAAGGDAGLVDVKVEGMEVTAE